MSAISQLRPIAAPVEPPSQTRNVLCLVAQAAIRVFSLAIFLLIGAAALPVSWYLIGLPIVAVVSAIITDIAIGKLFPKAGVPIFVPLQKPPVLEKGSPRGLLNVGQNCSFNSLIQFLENDPEVAKWLRQSLTTNTDQAAFVNFLGEYAQFRPLIADFTAYLQNTQSADPIAIRFRSFLAAKPDGAMAKELYENIIRIKYAAHFLYKEYDGAIKQDAPIVNSSQQLREALSAVNQSLHPHPHVQEDAAESLTTLLDLLPDAYKLHTQRTISYDNGYVSDQSEKATLLTLPIADPTKPASLQALLDTECDYTSIPEYRGCSSGSARLRFKEAPVRLHLQVKRFVSQQGSDGSFSMHKLHTPVDVPDTVSIPLANGTKKEYRLTSFITHMGMTVNSGHYTSGRIVNGKHYHISDEFVTQISPQEWQRELPQAYLLCYLPVESNQSSSTRPV